MVTMMQNSARLAWPDVARGIAVILVVYGHVVRKDIATSGQDVGALGFLEATVTLFEPIRMPLFFLISGLFAVSALNGPWSRVLIRKTAFFYYLYVIWLVIHTIVLLSTDSSITAVARTPVQLLAQLTVSPSALWYLWALAFYFILAKLCWSARWTMIVAGFGLHILAAEHWLVDFGNLEPGMRNFLWFALGATLAGPIRQAHVAFKWWWVPLSAAAYALACCLMVLGGEAWITVTFLTASTIGAWAGVVGAIAMTMTMKRLTKELAWVGGMTLQVYTLHVPLLALWIWFSAEWVTPLLVNPLVSVGYALALTAGIVGVCLAVPLRRYAPLLLTPPWMRQRSSTATANDRIT